MKHHEQVDAAVKKARNAAFLIRWLFRHLLPKVSLRAYTALVRPMLEYYIQVSNPTAKIEKVQRMATKLAPAIRMFPFEVRLAILGLFSMHRRRIRGDFIWVIKILKRVVRLDPARFFTLRLPCNRRVDGI